MDWEIVSGYQILLNYEDNVYTTIINKQMSSITGITYSGEKNSQYITFIMDRYYDGIDLSSKLINICYKIEGTQNGGSDAPINVYRNDNQIKFGWIIPYACTANANTISLGVLVVGTEYGQDYIFKTNTSKYSITQGFISGNGIIEPDDNWFEQFLIQYNNNANSNLEIYNTNATNKILAYNNNANSKLGDFNNLSDRLDALNTELIDIRVGAYGKTYSTAGDAVRGQITDLGAYIGYLPNNVIGLQVDFQNMEFTRLAGAVGLTAGADFNKFNMYGGRKRCNVADDGTINAYYGDEGYAEDGSNGQVMVYQPKFYYMMYPLLVEQNTQGIGYHLRKANYYVSDYPLAGFKLHPAFYDAQGNEIDYILMGAYEGSIFDVSANAYILDDAQVMDYANDLFCSIAGAKPASGKTQNLTRPNINQMCMNRGTGWYSDNIKAASANQMLMIIEMGTMNMQTAIGQGVVSVADDPNTENNSKVTGGTSALGNGTGQATGTSGQVSVSYRGYENPWGNIWKFIYGVNIWGDGTLGGGVLYYATDFNFEESKRTDNYVSAGFSVSNANGYVSAIGYAPECDWMFIGSEVLGNSSVPVGDYQWTTANLNGYRIARLGGSWNDGSYAGAFCWYLNSGVGNRSRRIGGRLVYVPTATA